MPASSPDRPGVPPAAAALAARFPDAVRVEAGGGGEASLRALPEALVALLRALKEEAGFVLLEDIAVFDNLRAPAGAGPRFTVVYRLRRPPEAGSVRLAVDVAEDGALPSATAVFRAADWAEREAFDMFGVRFDGHPDLRRIYMPDGFEGHPLRKDFPLPGREGGA
ncbi:MAG TPA: NADH-quinone oxidoreductase subunit C [Candidatus Aminicenantes bacterium]|nr:NADH-quinone oxidoreductase subunit C [Candidatus Aminicenantes bacterium]